MLVPKYLDEGLLPPSAGYPTSQHITAAGSGHSIMIDNGPVVIQTFEDVLAAVEAGRTTLSSGRAPFLWPGPGRARGACCVAVRAGRRVGARLSTTVRVTCPESPRSDGAHER